GAYVMRVQHGDVKIPFPLLTIGGRLRLSGLDDRSISDVLHNLSTKNIRTRNTILSEVKDSLKSYKSEIQTNFESLTQYERQRGEGRKLPAIIIVLEGASATGKSMLAIEFIKDLAATRFISTDSVRMVLRGIMDKGKHPELFCHTYQAHVHRQVGPDDLNPVVRGFLAQCEIISPFIKTMAAGIISEGTNAVVEGVHIQPGTLKNLSDGIIEVLINPDTATHRAMFMGKHELEKLETVSADETVRESEFEATHAIQEFMIEAAEKSSIQILPLKDYDKTRKSISSLVVSKTRSLLRAIEDGVTTQ
ncbi:MAG: hypothetical protein ACFFFK_12480, partial [Candidatus Thorarchaeota archaeon]